MPVYIKTFSGPPSVILSSDGSSLGIKSILELLEFVRGTVLAAAQLTSFADDRPDDVEVEVYPKSLITGSGSLQDSIRSSATPKSGGPSEPVCESSVASVCFGDPDHGFVARLSAESASDAGIGKHLNGSSWVQLGDGSPSGLHIVMQMVAPNVVVMVLASEPRTTEGVLLEVATPETPHWKKVMGILSKHESTMVHGIRGIARANSDSTADIYVITQAGQTRSHAEEQTMDLTHVTAREIGLVLDRAGVAWEYSYGGRHVKVRGQTNEGPGVDLVFFYFDVEKADFSIRGQFLNAQRVPVDNGSVRFEAPRHGPKPTALAQKVVDIYLMPTHGVLAMTVHASVVPLEQALSMRLEITPSDRQSRLIRDLYPHYDAKRSETRFWMTTAMTEEAMAESQFIEALQEAFSVGLNMFDGPFTGWICVDDL